MPQRAQFLAVVRSNLPLCRDHFKLVLHVAAFPASEPGQFIQIECRDPAMRDLAEKEIQWVPGLPLKLHDRELVAPMALLRRPFSLAGRREVSDGVELDIIHRVVGVGTQWLAHLRPGDRVDILGPLGNRFALPSNDRSAILVGGGVGVPPMLYLAAHLTGRRAVAFCGVVSRDLLPLTILDQAPANRCEPSLNISEFAAHEIPSVICTDDGTYGFRGFVTQALERFLDNAPSTTRDSPFIIYTCGPEPMMKRVAEIAIARGIECQIAVERAMACGLGTCQSCCIRVRKPDPKKPPLSGSDWCWRLACTDGPIFRGADLLW